MSESPFLSVIIPAYNEEKRLPKTLQAICSWLNSRNYQSEVIVVSDGSKDATLLSAQKISGQFPFIKAFEYKPNRGKGYATRYGMLEAKGQYQVFTDADNSTSIEQWEKMLPEFEKGFEVVIGSRDIKGAVLDPPQPFIRQFIGNCFNLGIQFLLGLWGIWDTQCGFKGFTYKASQAIFPKAKIDRFAFDPEILLIARKQGFKIKEIPVRWVNDLDSRVKGKTMFEMLKDAFRIKFNDLKGVYGK